MLQYPVLKSPVFQPKEDPVPRCIGFWFAPFGRGDATTLSVVFILVETVEADSPDQKAKETDGAKTVLWRISTRRLDTTRSEWIYGQVSVPTESPYRVCCRCTRNRLENLV